MKWNYIHLLILICVLLLPCNGLHADEVCSPDYPDQFPFYPEEECDDVTPLVWDHDNSATILADNSSGMIYVTGGILPLTVQVRGSGFWLDQGHTIQDGVVNGRSIGIYTDGDACGAATIYIIDGCSSVNGSINSTLGKWVARPSITCNEAGFGFVEADTNSGGYTIMAHVQIGRFKYSQGWSVQMANYNSQPCGEGNRSGCSDIIYPGTYHNGFCASTFQGDQTTPAWRAYAKGYPGRGSNFSCGWGAYADRCRTLTVQEWVCP